MPPTALDKKANFECLERDVGLAKFLPNVRYQINYMITIPYEDAIKRILSLQKINVILYISTSCFLHL